MKVLLDELLLRININDVLKHVFWNWNAGGITSEKGGSGIKT